MNEIKIFAPATIANISCGFDVLGCCLDAVGDEMIVRKSAQKGLRITKITGAELPLKTEENVAGVAGMALLNDLKSKPDYGFEIEIDKKIKPGSGIGSSAASAAGVVFALNELLGRPYSAHELIGFATKGEELVSGDPIADNVAPALLGGFTLVRENDPPDVVKLPGMKDLYAVILHPQIEIKTAESRDILPEKVPLSDAVKQWSYVGSLVHALHTDDYNLFGRSLVDLIVEPYRSKFIPGFHKVIEAARTAGGLGSGISGSGPSVFTFTKGIENAEKVKKAIDTVYTHTGIPYFLYISKINSNGVRVLSDE